MYFHIVSYNKAKSWLLGYRKAKNSLNDNKNALFAVTNFYFAVTNF